MSTSGERVSFRSYKAAVLILSVLGLVSTILLNEDVIAFSNDYMEDSRIMRVLRKAKPQRIDLIWLLGYPGAGSEQVIKGVEFATLSSMATNYGHKMDTKDRNTHVKKYTSVLLQKAWYRPGPFKNNVDYDIKSDAVLVKTYCTGYCFIHNEEDNTCSRKGFIRSLMILGNFWNACAKGRSYKPNRNQRTKSTKAYWKNRVRRVVVLVRDPVDIVISRYAYHTRKMGMKPTKVGFFDFCEGFNSKWGNVKEIKAKKKLGWLGLEYEGVPCYPEFFRIVAWYNNVYHIASKRDSIMIRYEDLEGNLKGGMSKILKFVGLKKENEKDYLPMNDVVPQHWLSKEEKKLIGGFMKTLARSGPMFPAYFDRYF